MVVDDDTDDVGQHLAALRRVALRQHEQSPLLHSGSVIALEQLFEHGYGAVRVTTDQGVQRQQLQVFVSGGFGGHRRSGGLLNL